MLCNMNSQLDYVFWDITQVKIKYKQDKNIKFCYVKQISKALATIRRHHDYYFSKKKKRKKNFTCLEANDFLPAFMCVCVHVCL